MPRPSRPSIRPRPCATSDISVVTGRAFFRLGEARIAPLAPGTELPAGVPRRRTRHQRPCCATLTAAALKTHGDSRPRHRRCGRQSIRADKPAPRSLDVAIRVEPRPGHHLRPAPAGGAGTACAPPASSRSRACPPRGLLPRGADPRRGRACAKPACFLPWPCSCAIRGTGPSADDHRDPSTRRRCAASVSGAELSSDEGVQLSAPNWLHRNLFGGAERLRFDATVSGINADVDGIDGELTARFERPATFSPDTDLALELGFAYLDEPLFSIEALSLGRADPVT